MGEFGRFNVGERVLLHADPTDPAWCGDAPSDEVGVIEHIMPPVVAEHPIMYLVVVDARLNEEDDRIREVDEGQIFELPYP